MERLANRYEQLLRWSGLTFYTGALLCGFFLLSANGSQHFRGGSTSVEILDHSHPEYYTVRMTIVTGWELDKGPCGPNCTVADIGRSTVVTRAEFINRTGDSEYFGRWSLESRYPDTSVGRSDITDHVNKNIQGRVNNINIPTRWMQEIAHFEVNINSSDYTDIVLEGDSWMDTQLQNCSLDLITHTCKYHLQQKIRLGIRNDTNKPNESPLVLYKPVYRVRLNEVTRIPIVVADNDGDACRCRSARFVELSLIHPIVGTNITSDCVVVISAFESDGFRDGDWGIVNVIVEDVPLNSVIMGGNLYQGKKDNLGQTQVQTLANLTSPEFIAPTPCVNGTEAHVPSYYMYSGTTLRLPLHAQATTEAFLDVNCILRVVTHPNMLLHRDIERFHLTSMPVQNLALPAPTLASGRPPTDNVWMSQLSWKIDVDHSAHYLLQAIAVDDRG
ncbi:carboxyl-ester lipase [Elysia marginata]|uniref:Carboxyl-ester lipase n=1 Tax=Elysia marginata TaxID=1093978 RepID=A0AAV4EX17_9GAST|nr:carboxyl-ester lipase [Elysia marginata]